MVAQEIEIVQTGFAGTAGVVAASVGFGGAVAGCCGRVAGCVSATELFGCGGVCSGTCVACTDALAVAVGADEAGTPDGVDAVVEAAVFSAGGAVVLTGASAAGMVSASSF